MISSGSVLHVCVSDVIHSWLGGQSLTGIPTIHLYSPTASSTQVSPFPVRPWGGASHFGNLQSRLMKTRRRQGGIWLYKRSLAVDWLRVDIKHWGHALSKAFIYLYIFYILFFFLSPKLFGDIITTKQLKISLLLKCSERWLRIQTKTLSDPDWLGDKLKVWTAKQFIANQSKWTLWHKRLLTSKPYKERKRLKCVRAQREGCAPKTVRGN